MHQQRLHNLQPCTLHPAFEECLEGFCWCKMPVHIQLEYTLGRSVLSGSTQVYWLLSKKPYHPSFELGSVLVEFRKLA